ncbi:hypothetical protein PVK06_028568 [Gossypium arboreum]|uniref:RNase H type-1 domain-containing protein n=1 Tax=Gossypium arboreum TaxID=29729 RepID=A0ABR0P3E1_GOSAR|nr:hypothetical protein PVK06_028568 [Gossypium arboreum]
MINIPRQIIHFFHPSCPLVLLADVPCQCEGCDEASSGLAFLCGKCKFQLDVKCALLPTVESKDADKIQHSAHEHPPASHESKEFGTEVRCRACGEHCLLAPCFGCSKRSCAFFLHRKRVVELYRKYIIAFIPYTLSLYSLTYLTSVRFGRSIGSGSVLNSQLWEILDGFNVAWQRGLSKVVVECDNRVATELLQDGSNEDNPLLLVQMIKEVCNESWTVRFQHVYREANQVADFMAKPCISRTHDLEVFEDPFPGCQHLFLSDKKGIT